MFQSEKYATVPYRPAGKTCLKNIHDRLFLLSILMFYFIRCLSTWLLLSHEPWDLKFQNKNKVKFKKVDGSILKIAFFSIQFFFKDVCEFSIAKMSVAAKGDEAKEKMEGADTGKENDDEEEDHNDVTSSSTSSSIDDIKAPQVRAQFEKLALVGVLFLFVLSDLFDLC